MVSIKLRNQENKFLFYSNCVENSPYSPYMMLQIIVSMGNTYNLSTTAYTHTYYSDHECAYIV